MQSPAGWSIHWIVLGVLAAVGIVITVADYAGPSGGGWISLRGVVSTLYWLLFVVFAVVSTISFGFLRARVGVPLSYVLGVGGAIVLGVVISVAWRAIEGKASEAFAREVASRLTLESWSVAEQPDGVVNFRVTVRADVEGSVRFEPFASIGGDVAVDDRRLSDEHHLKAGERAVLEASAKRTAQGAFDSFDLYFTSDVSQRETGSIAYSSDVKADTVVGSRLRRPLPPPIPR